MAYFPQLRLRRMRGTEALRALVRETRVEMGDLAYPLFVIESSGVKEEVISMPGIFRFSIDRLPQEVEEIAKLQNYDLVIYLEPDVEWVDDGLRFAGEEKIRKKNNKKLKKMFDERKISYITIDGNYQERFNKSKELVDKLFKN